MEAKDVMGIVSIGIVIDAIEAIDVIGIVSIGIVIDVIEAKDVRGIVSIVGGAVVDASDG